MPAYAGMTNQGLDSSPSTQNDALYILFSVLRDNYHRMEIIYITP